MPTTTPGILQFSQPIYKITESGEWLTEQVQVLRKDGATGNVSVKVTAKTETATVGKDIDKINQVLKVLNIEINEKTKINELDKFMINFKVIFQDYFTSVFIFTDEFLNLVKSKLITEVKNYKSITVSNCAVYPAHGPNCSLSFHCVLLLC
jgi:hypothetical protein